MTHNNAISASTRLKQRLSATLICFSTLVLSGCETISYYSQAIKGQLSILHAKESVESIVQKNDTSDKVKNKLATINKAREFAKAELGLPISGLYETFVQLEKPYVVWNVFAAPEFSTQAKTWCYPIVGCVSYRGSFKESKAQDYAKKMRTKGYDVFVGGVAAYSTLGWFEDPILSSFFYRSDEALAGLIFHELAHQLLYFDDDTTFNESFATTVELEGLRRYLNQGEAQETYQQYLNNQKHQQEFIALAISYREKLSDLYAELDNNKTINEQTRRAKKQKLLDELKQAYQNTSKNWKNPDRYTRWFEDNLNNAKLNTLATYHTLVAPLQKLLEINGNDLERFYQTCKDMESWNKQKRDEYLNSLIEPSYEEQ